MDVTIIGQSPYIWGKHKDNRYFVDVYVIWRRRTKDTRIQIVKPDLKIVVHTLVKLPTGKSLFVDVKFNKTSVSDSQVKEKVISLLKRTGIL